MLLNMLPLTIANGAKNQGINLFKKVKIPLILSKQFNLNQQRFFFLSPDTLFLLLKTAHNRLKFLHE